MNFATTNRVKSGVIPSYWSLNSNWIILVMLHDSWCIYFRACQQNNSHAILICLNEIEPSKLRLIWYSFSDFVHIINFKFNGKYMVHFHELCESNYVNFRWPELLIEFIIQTWVRFQTLGKKGSVPKYYSILIKTIEYQTYF